MPNQDRYIARPPRIQPELPSDVIEIPPPPRDDDQRQPLWQSMVPIISILGYILVSFSGQGQNLAFVIPMALTVVISTSVTVFNVFNGRHRRREKIAAYQRLLSEMRRDMVTAQNRQRTFYEYNYPKPDVILEMRGEKPDNRSGTRLWERRNSDTDFGTTRLGLGTRPSSVVYTFQNKSDGEVSVLDPEAKRLADDSLYVREVPITLPLFQQQIAGPSSQNVADQKSTESQNIAVKHMVGIAGAGTEGAIAEVRQAIYEFVYSLTAHYIAFHSPNDLELYILGASGAEERWRWAYGAHHCIIDESKGQYRIYFEDAERIFSPYSGVVEELCVKRGDVIPADFVVARIRVEGRLETIRSTVAGRVDNVNSKFINPETKTVSAKGKKLDEGELVVRLRDFELSEQQLEQELNSAEELQNYRGKENRRREIAGVPRFWKEKIWSQLDKRANRLRDNEEKENLNLRLPFMLLIVDLLYVDFTHNEQKPITSWLEELESEAAISLLTAQGAELGAAVIFLVPDRSRVPSGCQSIVELRRDSDNVLKFLYAEVGLNSPRYVGVADTIENDPDPVNDEISQTSREFYTFLRELRAWNVRRSYGADIPRSVGLLNLYNVNTIEAMDIEQRWDDSIYKTPEWPKIPLGMLPGSEPRSLHFFADADGVHGMIAGSTGSGKSELLMTMILSLAVRYDPSMVNFVLIDYKGGGTFDNFKDLPHVVDNVNNLGKNAVARMFAAINAELNRRQHLNQQNKIKDIVRYREQKYHINKQENYPHLFVVIDEFAEMIANDPEYKAQLESITRLGRALGVSLILAAQRPSGVTDQMRSNIKFKLCLRVETREESSELLRRPDASYLPSIPGRGYLQVGNDSLELIQVGYTGESYSKSRFDDYETFERFQRRPIIWEDEIEVDLSKDEPMYDVLVRRMANLKETNYDQKDKSIPWGRPWPQPLPQMLSLDSPIGVEVDYIRDRDDLDDLRLEPGEDFSLAPPLTRRLKSAAPLPWTNINWEFDAMQAFVGLVDDPRNAKLRLLRVNFKQGHYVVFGTAGYGKTVFLQSVVTNLICSHSPGELNVYILDFGSRGFMQFNDRPHVGAWILDHESDRVERLLRFLDQEINRRKTEISDKGADNLYQYNKDAKQKMPAILVVIDNYAVFRENYEPQIENLISIVRDGLSAGVHFLVSAEQPGTVGKLFPLLPERITLKLADESEYVNIVGRGAFPIEDIPGRGLQNIDRKPLELQIATPVGISDDDENRSGFDRLVELLDKITTAAKEFGYRLPPQIKRLPESVALPDLIERQRSNDLKVRLGEERGGVVFEDKLPTKFVIGVADLNLEPLVVSLDVKPHFVIVGPPSSGRTTVLQNLILSLAEVYTPEQCAFILIDPQRSLAEYGGDHELTALPHSLLDRVVSAPDDIPEILLHLTNEFVTLKDHRPPRDVYVIFDNYERDDIDELMSGSSGEKPLQKLGKLARTAGRGGLHFIVAGMSDTLRGGDDLMRPIGALRHGLALDYEAADSSPLNATMPRIYSHMTLPRGRGFYVYAGKGHLVQASLPYWAAEKRGSEIDGWIDHLNSIYPVHAQWLSIASPEMIEEVGKLTPEQRKQIIAAYAVTNGLELNIAEKQAGMRDDDELLNWVERFHLVVPSLSSEYEMSSNGDSNDGEIDDAVTIQ
jgi:DNA segregation ATPase FtsK/SpoIIIE-like protein